jgi:phosphatidylethanolamine-binding protein (PEBP) family uncharacterized protein
VFALDVEHCPVGDRFTGAELIIALDGHILDRASLMGTYSLNPSIE